MKMSQGWPIRPFRSLEAGLAFAILATGAAYAQASRAPFADPQPARAGSFELRPGVVLAGDLSTLYMMKAEGGLTAISTATGTESWTMTQTLKPLSLSGDLLLAQAEPAEPGVLRLVLIDHRTGLWRDEARAPLPPEVRGGVRDGLRGSFRARGAAEGSDFAVLWQSTWDDSRGSGYQPAASESPGSSGWVGKTSSLERFEGALRLDAASGKVETLRGPEILVQKSAPRPSVGLWEGDYLEGVDGRQFLSADGRHVLASELVSHRVGYLWSIHTRGGQFLGRTVNRFSVAPFVVAGDALIFEARPYATERDGQWVEQDLGIEAVDLLSGAQIFSQALLQLEYDGPLPP